MALNTGPLDLRLSATVTATGDTLHHQGQKHQETWTRTHKLGEGAYGAVWQEKCTSGPQHRLQQLRAVKVSRRRNEKAWRRELSAMRKFSQYPDRFVQLLGWFEDTDSLHIAMEYIGYGTLNDYVRQKALPEGEASVIVTQLAQALQYMHNADYLHRDLKLLNILVAHPAPDWHVKVADFGVTKDMSSMGATTADVGTLSYMAPEILLSREDKYTKAGDIWSLGVVAYCLLSRNPPFKYLYELMDFGKGGVPFPSKPLERKRCSFLSIKFIEAAMSPARENRPTIDKIMIDPWLVPEPETDSDQDDAEDWGAPSKDWADTWDHGTKQDSGVTIVPSGRREVQPQGLKSEGKAPVAAAVSSNVPVDHSVSRRTYPLRPKANSNSDNGQLGNLVQSRLQQADTDHDSSHSKSTLQTQTLTDDQPKLSKNINLPTKLECVQAKRIFDQFALHSGITFTDEEKGRLKAYRTALDNITAAVHGDPQKQEYFATQEGQEERAFYHEAFSSVELLDAMVRNFEKLLPMIATQGLTAILKVLVEEEGVDATDPGGFTMLHHAVLGGSVKSVKFLLAQGCNMNVVSETHGTPLCLAAVKAQHEILALLLESKADVLAPGGYFGSALHAACASGDAGIAQTLLEHGAQLELQRVVRLHFLAGFARRITAHFKFMSRICPALAIAVDAGDFQMVKLLLGAGADVNALHQWWFGKDLEVASFAEAAVTSKIDSFTTLMIAAAKNFDAIAQLLLDSGADRDARDSDGETVAMLAARWGSHLTLEILLTRGASVQARDVDGWSCLLFAAYAGQTRCLSLLVDHGVDIDEQNRDGYTALFAAAHEGHAECVRLLCSSGAALNHKAHEGFTALMVAVQEYHVECVELLCTHGATLNIQNNEGCTALISAAQYGYAECVKLLCTGGASLDIRTEKGFTALMFAAQCGSAECVMLLCSSGASLNVQNLAGDTALTIAAWQGHVECVKLLCIRGASLDIRNNEGFTALKLAIHKSHADTVNILREYGA